VITGLAHAAVCVPDIDEAVQWYADVLGCRVLSPPYRMEGVHIERDMGELVPSPVVISAAIVGFGVEDHVIELVEYPAATITATPAGEASILHTGVTHIGLVCDDIAVTRVELEARGVEFLTAGVADIAGLRTTWFRDPWGAVFILMEKRRDQAKPYWGQFAQN
jgi:catechol 2,3-dioxygenase-like lactoylglutathione lyase family enzyme